MKPKRILCLEDKTDDCELLRYFLGKAGYQIVFASTCAEALEKAQAEQFDLYFFDVILPDCSGIDLAHQIRKFDQTTPLIFHSASAYPDQIQARLAAGAVAYITKPSDPDELVAAIKRLLTPATTYA